MQQRFKLSLLQETIADDAAALNVKASLLTDIAIEVMAHIEARMRPYLWLDYQISLPKPLLALIDWEDWRKENAVFSDFLWEKTCLECFLQFSKQSGYVEINAAPSGEFAIYQFLDYRTPNQLPPKPLLLNDKFSSNQMTNDNRASVFWQNSDDLNPPAALLRRKFAIDLSQTPNFDVALPHFGLIKLQPCVILAFGKHQLYFAPHHALPPDFHDSKFWQDFNPKP